MCGKKMADTKMHKNTVAWLSCSQGLFVEPGFALRYIGDVIDFLLFSEQWFERWCCFFFDDDHFWGKRMLEFTAC